MPTATNTALPDSFDFTQAWTGYSARTQRIQAVLMDTAKRLAEARIETGAEAYMEAFSHMVAVMATPSPGLGLAEWPARILSAQTRAWRTQQAHLDIWTHAMKATVDVFTEEGVYPGRAAAPVSGHVAAGHFIERRVSAEVINFADRRKLRAIGVPTESRGIDNSGVSAGRQAGTLRR